MTSTIKSASVRARIEPQVKKNAEDVLDQLGLSMSEAISLYLNQIVHHKGIPFSIRIPNEETRKAIQEAREGETTVISMDELAEQFNIT